MPNLFACPPGAPLSTLAAEYILRTHPSPHTLVLVPTRRACVAMARAFQQVLGDKTAMLPRIVALSDIDQSLVALLGEDGLNLLERIAPAMPDWQQRYMLARHIAAFEGRRNPGGATRLDQSLALAQQLMALQDECARHEITLTPASLQALGHGGFAQHWALALQFLSILAEHWPAVEAELGLTTKAARETAMLRALAAHWAKSPPNYAVVAVGSTASQPATAQLLHIIGALPNGAVVLPGLDPTMPDTEWQRVEAGHPLFYLKQLLDHYPLTPSQLAPLGAAARSLWQEALVDRETLAGWPTRPLPEVTNLKLIPCAHREEEARVVALLLREGAQKPGRTALITPDEGFLACVSAQLQRFGLQADRMRTGTLAETETGSLWLHTLACVANPERLLHLRQLLHHPLSEIDREYLRSIEPYFHGVANRRPGQLPRLPDALRAHHETARLEKLLQQFSRLSGATLDAQGWLNAIEALQVTFEIGEGSGREAVAEALAVLADAPLPPMGVEEFSNLVTERLAEAWRNPALKAHPQLVMLTPVEARIEQFERVILATMTDTQWPGMRASDAWLNLAARQKLGLPGPLEATSLMAHDLLMLGSGAELFLTWSQREEGAPTTRSRFIERLVTLLATHGQSADSITDRRYAQWAAKLDAGDDFAPAAAPMPTPSAAQRPTRLPASQLDTLFTNPYQIYARYVLGLAPLKPIDAEPEPSDFGSLAHRAIQLLTEQWNTLERAASQPEIERIAERALQGFSEQPGIALFWRTRLVAALVFVNAEETKRRSAAGLKVTSEVQKEAPISLGRDANSPELILYGRIDRVEEGAAPCLVDYKTGKIPTAKEILDGRAVQLLV
ncbi:MAG: PD-(D/E)XK nuclease family protein, partial [Rickettsiales bacterium]